MKSTIIIIAMLLVGCATTKAPDPVRSELQITPFGILRFHPSTGETELMMQTETGMVWITIPDYAGQIIMIPTTNQMN